MFWTSGYSSLVDTDDEGPRLSTEVGLTYGRQCVMCRGMFSVTESRFAVSTLFFSAAKNHRVWYALILTLVVQ